MCVVGRKSACFMFLLYMHHIFVWSDMCILNIFFCLKEKGINHAARGYDSLFGLGDPSPSRKINIFLSFCGWEGSSQSLD